MIDMLEKEDDEIDLALQAMSKRIFKKNLNDEKQEDLMEELSSTVTRPGRPGPNGMGVQI